MAMRSTCLASWFLHLSLYLAIAPAHAQSCPPTIDIAERLTKAADGFNVKDHASTRSLTGMSVVEGPLLEEPAANAVLAPLSMRANGHFWPFRTAIGDSEVWMRCHYQGSGISLDRRVEPHVRKCTVTRSKDPKTGNTSFLAECA